MAFHPGFVPPPHPPKGGLKNLNINALSGYELQPKTDYYVLIWRFLKFDFRCIELSGMKSRVIERNMFYAASRNTFKMAHSLRKDMTDAEKILWKRLKDKRIFKVKFRRQHPVDIFVLDFYCHELKLAIEVDGEIHLNAEVREYDEGRTYELEKFGIKILRYTNEQIFENLDEVLVSILNIINDIAPL